MKFLILIPVLFLAFCGFEQSPKTYNGYKIDWVHSTDRPWLLAGWSATSKPLFDKNGNIYICAGYRWHDEFPLFKLDTDGNRIWEHKECGNRNIHNDKIVMPISPKDSDKKTLILDTVNGNEIAQLKHFKRLTKTPKWFYALSEDNKIIRINPQTFEEIELPYTTKAMHIKDDNLVFIEATLSKLLFLNDTTEKAEAFRDIDFNYQKFHMFMTDNFICIPHNHYEDPIKIQMTTCFGEKKTVMLHGTSFPLDTSITYEDKIIVRNTMENHPLYGWSLYDLEPNTKKEYKKSMVFSNMAFVDGQLYFYNDRKLKVLSEDEFKTIFKSEGYIKYVRKNNGKLYVATDHGQLFALSIPDDQEQAHHR